MRTNSPTFGDSSLFPETSIVSLRTEAPAEVPAITPPSL